MNWKNFKNWLEQNIIETDGFLVKVRVNKQNKYGKLSTRVLTNFCDSLEATLGNNSSYHLFPNFSNHKSFEELFDYQVCYFGKNTNQERISKTDYNLLEKVFNEWKLMQNDKNISKNNTTLKENFEELKTKILEDDNEERDINLGAELKAVTRINIELQRSRSVFFESMFNSMFRGNDYICQKSENLTKFIDMSTVSDSPPNPSWADCEEYSLQYVFWSTS